MTGLSRRYAADVATFIAEFPQYEKSVAVEIAKRSVVRIVGGPEMVTAKVFIDAARWKLVCESSNSRLSRHDEWPLAVKDGNVSIC